MAKKKDFIQFWKERTTEMTIKEKAVYMELLIHQHDNKDLPNNTEKLASISKVGHKEFLEIWTSIQGRFTHDNGRIFDNELKKLSTHKPRKPIPQKTGVVKANGNYQLFIEKWFNFFERQGLPKPVMNGVQGKSMKALVTYFEARSKEKGSNPVDAFEYVLNHWHDLEEWMQTAALDLKVFASKLNSILSQIKNGSRSKQSVVQDIVSRAKGSEYFDKL